MFVMRVEDLDFGRVRDEYRVSQPHDLRWIGLDWDEGPDVGGPHTPYLQSRRTELYEDAINRLRAKGLVYSCSCSRREIAAAASAPHGVDDEGPPYPGSCRLRPLDPAAEDFALRFRVPSRPVVVDDLIQGKHIFDPEKLSGDFVIRRRDGVASYQLAVVVDDLMMEITHVVRGADLLPSAARQMLLYQALDREPPRWLHVPLMLDEAGERMAKREGSLTLGAIRERGVPPERLVGWLAWTCGLLEKPREVMPVDLVAGFDPARIPPAGTPVTLPDWLTGRLGP
jgi:glutamyl-tRNA synthetase